MPIEIKELIIRASVEREDAGTGGRSSELEAEERRQIIADCVEQVIDILRRQTER